VFLDIIQRPVYITKHNVSGTGFCLRLQEKPTQAKSIELVPIFGDRTQSPKRFVLKHKQGDVLYKNRTMDNVQKHNIHTNVPS
jgi:hypothetical protein